MSPDFPTDFLDALQRTVIDRASKKEGNEIRFRCPVDGHADNHPSARWNPAKATWCCDGCGAGGGALDLADRLGVPKPERTGAPLISSPKRLVHSYTPDLTLEQYAEAKKLPIDFCRSLGMANVSYRGGKAVRIPYLNEDGTKGATRYRTALAKSLAGDRFVWESGSQLRLYGLDRKSEWHAVGFAVGLEGESCAQTAWFLGIPAFGIPGASNWRDDRDAPHFEGIGAVYVVVEPDQGGAALRKKLADSLLKDRVWLIDLSPYGAKDLSDLYLADPGACLDRFEEARANATRLAAIDQSEQRAAYETAYKCAYELLHEPDILAKARAIMRARGYAGDTRPAEIAYVVIASSDLEAPLNAAFIAQSGAGKNRAVDEARDLFDADKVYEVKASSSKALIYNDASFEHRVVLFSEADSIPEEGPAASAVRNIASDNEMVYEVVEFNDQSKKWESRRIEKKGPTSLMTTSTRSLRNQLDTRVLEVPIPDDKDQTRAVMRSHAATVMPARRAMIDLEPFRALHRWISLAGERRVAVPFAEALAGILPSNAVRMRRDFRQLLTFIQAVALLHQCGRARTPDGWIEATYADYESARRLLAPIFDVTTSEGVTVAIRQVIEYIASDEEVSLSDLSKRLDLAKTTIQWRVSRAIKGGWIVNRETRRGQPAKLARGTPLPDDKSALPTVEKLRSVYECTSRSGEDIYPPPSAETSEKSDRESGTDRTTKRNIGPRNETSQTGSGTETLDSMGSDVSDFGRGRPGLHPVGDAGDDRWTA